MIPGINLLNMAHKLIAFQTVTYHRYASRTPNSVGILETNYEDPIQIQGSWQAVNRNLMMINGLDLQKQYYTFYASVNLLDVQRDLSGDQLTFNGRRYQVESENDWFAMDGWKGVLVVDIGVDSD